MAAFGGSCGDRLEEADHRFQLLVAEIGADPAHRFVHRRIELHQLRPALLTVTGRRSGLPHSTPVTLMQYHGGWSLGSPFGAVDWVKNLRAAGEAEILRRGRTVRVKAEEFGPGEAAAVLKENLSDLGPGGSSGPGGGYFDIPFDAPLADWEGDAPRHPTFILREQASS